MNFLRLKSLVKLNPDALVGASIGIFPIDAPTNASVDKNSYKGPRNNPDSEYGQG